MKLYLYFGNAVTTVTTVMILALLSYIGYSFVNRSSIQHWGRRSLLLLAFGLVACCFAATRDGLDKTIQHAIDSSCAPGLFPLVSIPIPGGGYGKSHRQYDAVGECDRGRAKKEREIPTDFGETLSWNYLLYVRANPISWNVSTCILCGERDNLTSMGTISAFARRHNAKLTVMPGGEHWLHTAEQMRFLDDWIKKN